MMTNTADLIRYFYGRILTETNGIYLVYYGDTDILCYGIGCMVQNTATGSERCYFRTYDVPNYIKQEEIDRLLAAPETIDSLLTPEKWRPPHILRPIRSDDLPKLLETIRTNAADWEDVAEFPDFLLVKRIRHLSSDRYALVTYKEPCSPFIGGPPLWDKTVTKEQAALFSKNPDKMYAYYLKLTAEEARRRAES